MTNIAQDTLQMMTKIGLFYGSTTCYTEMAGEKIRDTINLSLGFSAVTLHDIALDPITKWVIQNGFKTHWVISGLKSELKGQVPLALGLTKGLNLRTQKHFPQTRKCS